MNDQSLLNALHANFPDLRIDTFAPLHEGWGNRTFLVNDQLVFRFPKYEQAANNLIRERRLLDELAPTVPLSIPCYTYHGQPTSHYPFAFGGYAFIPGTPLSQCSPDVQEATWWQPQLGAFLTALHRFPAQRAQHLLQHTLYPTAQAWQEAIVDLCARIRAQIFPLLAQKQRTALDTYFESILQDGSVFAFTPVLIHQDFYFQNILVDVTTETVTGVLDWSNCTIGDPAEDVWIPLQYYDGVVDRGWDKRREFAVRTGPFPDMLYMLEQGRTDNLAPMLRWVDELWPS